jgi:hypothetical protein
MACWSSPDIISELKKNDSSLKTVRAELVEALSFSFNALPEEKQPFDKLRANGGGLESLSFGISPSPREGGGAVYLISISTGLPEEIVDHINHFA